MYRLAISLLGMLLLSSVVLADDAKMLGMKAEDLSYILSVREGQVIGLQDHLKEMQGQIDWWIACVKDTACVAWVTGK